jgi:DNA-binding Lrp family transcriptional regulator
MPGEIDERFYAKKARSRSRVVLTSGGDEPVMDAGKSGHSVFGYFFLKTLRDYDRPYLIPTQIFAEVKLNAHGRSNFTEFTEAIRGFPEVLECYVLMGAVDFLLRIVTSDIEAYERFFFEKLSMVPGIQEVNSIVALSEIKSTTSLPVLR